MFLYRDQVNYEKVARLNVWNEKLPERKQKK